MIELDFGSEFSYFEEIFERKASSDSNLILGREGYKLEEFLLEILYDEDSRNSLNHLLSNFAISKRLKQDIFYQNNFLVQYWRTKEKYKSKFNRGKGMTIGENDYNLVLSYLGAREIHSFGCLSFGPKSGGIIVDQIQGLTTNHNSIDHKFNLSLVSKVKWDKLLISYLIERASECGVSEIEIVGVKNQPWLKQTYSSLKKNYEGSFISYDEFITLNDEDIDIFLNDLSFQAYASVELHQFPSLARKRYDDLALSLGFQKNNFGNYILDLN